MNQKQPNNAWTTVTDNTAKEGFKVYLYFSQAAAENKLLTIGTYVRLRFRITDQCLVVDVWDDDHPDGMERATHRAKVSMNPSNPKRPLRLTASLDQLPDGWHRLSRCQSHLAYGRSRGHQELLIDRRRAAKAPKPTLRKAAKTDDGNSVKGLLTALRAAVRDDFNNEYFCRVEGRDIPWEQVSILRCPKTPDAEEL